MVFERPRPFRLVARGGAGLACDADGVTLGGITLASGGDAGEGERRLVVRPVSEIGHVLEQAYGPQDDDVVQRCHRGLKRVASRLEEGDLALAGIEAVMLRLPEIDAEGMAKLAAADDIAKGGDSWRNEPRVPAGQSDGGQWTTGGGEAGEAASAGRTHGEPGRIGEMSPRSRRGAQPVEDGGGGTDEVVVTSPVHQSRTKYPNGFYRNSAGGGVFYVPSAFAGGRVRPTEVHALDAKAFRVSWDDGVIRLRDARGTTYAVAADVESLSHFNATTGAVLGVSIYAFPDTPLGSADAPPTPEEREQLDRERTAQAAGVRASEQSLSGRVTTYAVGGVAMLPLIFALPEALAVAPEGASLELNLPRGIALARRLGSIAEKARGISGPKESIRIPGAPGLRIPDALDRIRKILTEIKNVRNLSYTRQMRDFANWCKVNGFKFYLYVRKSTTFSKPLQEAIDRGEIIVKYLAEKKIRLRYIPTGKR